MGNNINAINGFGGIGGSGALDTKNTKARQAQEEAARQAEEQRSSYDPRRPVHYVAPEAEPTAFRRSGSDAFGKMKDSSDNLQLALKNEGFQQSQLSQEHLEALAKKQMTELLVKIDQAKSEGDRQQVKDLEKRYVALQDAAQDYQVSFEKLNFEALSKNALKKGGIDASASSLPSLSKEELNLLKEFQEVTGLSATEGHDIESLRQEAFQKLKAQATELTQQKNALEKEVEGFKKSALEPAEKHPPAELIKAKESELSHLKSRLNDVQARLNHSEDIADKIVFLKAKRDLMGERDDRLSAAAERSSSLQSASAERRTSSSQRSSRASGSSGSSESSASVHGNGQRSGERLEQVDLRIQDTGDREFLQASDGEDVGQNESQDSVAVMLGAQSTFMEVQSTANNLTEQARKTDRQLQKMLQAVKAGNFEALTACMLLITKKFGNTVLNIGSKAITALQYYDKQTADLSRQLTNIQGNDTRANARLSQVSLRMNQYSSDRTSVMNLFKESLSGLEEGMSNLKSFLQKKEQIASIAAR